MFTVIARLILRNRTAFLVALFLGTSFMVYQATSIQMSFKFSRLLPTTDTTQIEYNNFQKTFDQAGNTIVLAVENYDVFSNENFNNWHAFEERLAAIEGVQNVISPTRSYNIQRNDSTQELELSPVVPDYQNANLKKIKANFFNLPFYQELLYSKDQRIPILLVQIEEKSLYVKRIVDLVEEVKKEVVAFEKDNEVRIHASGLPYIRMANTKQTSKEIFMFIGLSLGITTILLLFFLKSFKATFVSLLVVVLGVCWSLGLISSFGFTVTMLTSLVPSLIIVIGVPNCIFLINKYHSEYKGHGNQVLSVQRVIRRIGAATLITNTTTALGFAALTLTDSVILREFGIIAAVNILMVFVISIIIIPIFYSFSKPPKKRHYKHLEKDWVNGFIGGLTCIVNKKRKLVYLFLILFIGVALFGTTKMYTTGNLTESFRKVIL
jgi:predicted RND superfamily exporter protein